MRRGCGDGKGKDKDTKIHGGKEPLRAQARNGCV
jgi:hypothetical protein